MNQSENSGIGAIVAIIVVIAVLLFLALGGLPPA